MIIGLRFIRVVVDLVTDTTSPLSPYVSHDWRAHWHGQDYAYSTSQYSACLLSFYHLLKRVGIVDSDSYNSDAVAVALVIALVRTSSRHSKFMLRKGLPVLTPWRWPLVCVPPNHCHRQLLSPIMSIYNATQHLVDEMSETVMKKASQDSEIDDATRKYALKRGGSVTHFANATRSISEARAIVAFLTPQKRDLGLRFHQSKHIGGGAVRVVGHLHRLGRGAARRARDQLRRAAYKVSSAQAVIRDMRSFLGDSLNATAKRAPGTTVGFNKNLARDMATQD